MNYLVLFSMFMVIYLVYKYKVQLQLLKALLVFLFKKKLLEYLNDSNKNVKSNSITFKDKHVHITYTLNEKVHSLRIPYESKNKLKIHQMILIKENDKGEIEEIDITHSHGIPYFLAAKDLGGTRIIKKKGGETISHYEHEEVPQV